MNSSSFRSSIIVLAALIVLLVTFGIVVDQSQNGSQDTILILQPPVFVHSALAGSSQLGDYLDSEAGISAYLDSGFSINLASVRSTYRTIESETADYIIGSMAVTGYAEHFDPHVFVHKSGWIMAYYLRADPVSIILDTKGKTIDTTLLKTTVGTMASAAGVPFTDVVYYDFRYPNATKMLFVAEDSSDGNDFTIKLPSSYGYFERGWNVAGYPSNGFSLNGVSKPNQVKNIDYQAYGIITAGQLPPDVTHTITASQYGVLVIVYKD